MEKNLSVKTGRRSGMRKLSPLISVSVLGFSIVFFAYLVRADEVSPAPGGDQTAKSSEDPFEGVNRVTSDVNRALREVVIDPVVDGYQAVTPDPLQQSISNIFSNLSEPVTAISSLLQGDAENAGTATNRFIINTTIGLGGVNDPATDMGLQQRREDLGQAMGSYGVASGPHFVLPILGPTNLRDVTGDLLTGLASPVPLVVQAGGTGVQYSTYQDDINAVSNRAVDPYVAEREAYEQHRAFVVNNGDNLQADFPSLDMGEGPSLAKTPK